MLEWEGKKGRRAGTEILRLWPKEWKIIQCQRILLRLQSRVASKGKIKTDCPHCCFSFNLPFFFILLPSGAFHPQRYEPLRPTIMTSIGGQQQPGILPTSRSSNLATTAYTNDHNTKGKQQRNYQLFPGRNRFFCRGRLMTSREYWAFLIALVILLIPSALFFAFTWVSSALRI